VYQFTAAQSGIKSGELEVAVSRLSRTLGEAAQGSDSAVKAFRDIGVGVLDASGKVRSTDAVMADIADRIQKIEDPAKRAAVAVEFFGRTGQRMLPMLSQGAAGMDRFRAEAKAAGAVLSDDLISKADAASDAIAAMSKSFQTLAQTLVAMASGPIKQFADAWVDALKRINENSRFNKELDAQKDHIQLLREERGLIEQIAQMRAAVGANPLPRDEAAIRKLEDRVAAIRAQITAAGATILPTGFNGTMPGAAGAATIPQSQSEIKKAEDDARRAREKAERETADRIRAINETVANSLIDTYEGIGKFLEQQGRERDERLKAEVDSVTKGLDALNEANNKRLLEAYEANQRAIEDNKREFREYADIVGQGFQDMILNARKFDDVLKGLLARFASRAIGSATDSLFGSLLSSFGGIFGKAGGGTISGPTVVGERGPEIFNPGGSGTILPMSRVGGGGGNTYNIDARGAAPGVHRDILLALQQTENRAVSRAVNTVRARNSREPAFLGGR
jgi:hypothetical protein